MRLMFVAAAFVSLLAAVLAASPRNHAPSIPDHKMGYCVAIYDSADQERLLGMGNVPLHHADRSKPEEFRRNVGNSLRLTMRGIPRSDGAGLRYSEQQIESAASHIILMNQPTAGVLKVESVPRPKPPGIEPISGGGSGCVAYSWCSTTAFDIHKHPVGCTGACGDCQHIVLVCPS